MNTRQAIQPSTTPNVLSISISASRKRLVAGLSDGFRTFRMDNCLTTCKPNINESVSIAAALDDRFSAYVSTHRHQDLSGPTVVVFYDSVLELELSRFDFHEPVLGLRLTSKWMAVILADRTILYQYQELQSSSPPTQSKEILRAPNLVHSLHKTSPNTLALGCLSNNLLVLPSQTLGELQLISLDRKNSPTKRVLPAHDHALRCISLSQDGKLIATASLQGTRILIFNASNLSKIAEFRRGMDKAIIFNLAFSPKNRFVAATSDKGTLHIFDLRPTEAPVTKHRKVPSYATSNTMVGPSNLSAQSSSQQGRSSPSGHGSVQEYYGLRPPPISTNVQPATQTFANAFKGYLLPKEIRSVCSAPFFLGDERKHWQGGPSHSWTTAPNGTRKRVANPVLALPNEPTGRAVKGICAFAPRGSEGGPEEEGAVPEEESAVVYVIGGGADARWEMFEIGRTQSGEWRVVLRGFRRFLTRQFVD